ncbi:MAG: ribosome biogenesis GTPase Der [Chloroflexi bacterium]|nr:ribosome biogenesis GTPase Der [Chloroflexota bacterium]
MSKPIVAIVGRPNVGKSTLLNRLLGERKAIVEDLPGTTRDRISADISWEGHEFTLVDSGGLEMHPESGIQQKVREQIEMAIAEADLILFLVDARDGTLPADEEIVDVLRRWQKPMLLVVNKVDIARQNNEIFQFYELGVGEPIPISAYHGRGIDELLEKITANLPLYQPISDEPEAMRLAIVGRPNVGKSLLANTLLGEERLIVHESPGTTRDTVDTVVDYNGERVILVDTAGIRRRGRIEPGIEKYSFTRASRAIERADVAILLTDAEEGITAQDIHILGYIQKAFKGAIFAVNKWDLAEVPDANLWTQGVRHRTRFMPYIEILFLSAKTGYGVEGILPTAKKVYQERFRRPSTTSLNNMLREAVAAHLPPKKGLKKLKVYRALQTGVNPPSFVFWVNDPTLVHFSYRRYLENKLRQSFGFRGTPLHLTFKGREAKRLMKKHKPVLNDNSIEPDSRKLPPQE